MIQKKLLILVGGGVKKIEKFKQIGEDLGLDVTLASFSDVNYSSFKETELKLFVNSYDVALFDVVYFRMVGKRIEDTTLVARYCRKHGIRVVDRIYLSELLFPSSVAKSIEMSKLIEAGIAVPKTVYGSVSSTLSNAKKEFGYPFVVKSTSGRKARDTWFIDTNDKEKKVRSVLEDKEKAGMRFFGQEFIAASQRERILVVGEEAVAAITRPTKWRKKIGSRGVLANPEGFKGQIKPIPSEYILLAIKATKAVDLDISGVDIVRDDVSKRLYVLEVNAAPSWKLIEKDCNLRVEEIILKYLVS